MVAGCNVVNQGWIKKQKKAPSSVESAATSLTDLESGFFYNVTALRDSLVGVGEYRIRFLNKVWLVRMIK